MKSMLIKRGVWIAVLLLVSLSIASCSEREPLSELPADFETYHGDQREPLILLGDRAVPVVLQRIRDKKMPRRRAAIRFLGNGKYPSALPVLQELYSDTTDPDRDVLLTEIFRIDQSEGSRLAMLVRNDKGDLGKSARDVIVRERYLLKRRSFFEAWLAYQGLEPND
ncbi:MAG: HEAT repeat domain-containing protein [Acidobacteria bacterium]|nr:HEAT repeat domain-containing protein [Acidobacteriota bacterium]